MTGLWLAAFGAGMVATVNPCGFAMLPAYLGIFLGSGSGPSLGRLTQVAGSVSAGFITVFLLAGTVIAAGLRSIIGWIPWMAAAVGVVLILVGLGVLSGRLKLLSLPAPGRANRSGTLRGMYGFGVAYAVASLSCTLPIFLSLVASAVAGRSFVEASGGFVAYGLGMSLVVSTLTVATALGRQGVVARIRSFSRYVHVISGVFLLGAGAFIVWYWATFLTSGTVALGENPVVRFVDQTSSAISNPVAQNPVLASVALLSFLAVIGSAARLRRRLASKASEPSEVRQPSP